MTAGPTRTGGALDLVQTSDWAEPALASADGVSVGQFEALRGILGDGRHHLLAARQAMATVDVTAPWSTATIVSAG